AVISVQNLGSAACWRNYRLAILGIKQCCIVILFKGRHFAVPEAKDLHIAAVILYMLVTPAAASLNIDLAVRSRYDSVRIFPRDKFIDKPVKGAGEIIKNRIPEFFYGVPAFVHCNGAN